MKVAISTDDGAVSAHFGRCPKFTIVEIEDGKAVKKEVIDNPGHSTGFLPKFFNEQKVDCVVAGGAGFRAQQLFDDFGIKLLVGVQGKIDEIVEKLAKGELKAGESMCKPQSGKGYGIEKEDSKDH